MRSAFSLVELSIVLVILGLITGGILAGQSLIRAAELRSVVADYQRYVTATQTFRDKYMAAPGDFNKATTIWGDNASACPDASITDGTPGTCNGDGNDIIIAGATGGATAERFQFWNQLALAGLIGGTYTGLAGPNSITHTIGGTNAPSGKISNSVWFTNNWDSSVCSYCYTTPQYGNSLYIGGTVADIWPTSPIFTPTEAWSIDTKLDDGLPAVGKVVGAYYNNSCGDGTSASDPSANYKLSNSAVACALFFPRAY